MPYLLPILALLCNAFFWGVSWWPFRAMHGAGLHPLWATALMYGLVSAGLLALRDVAEAHGGLAAIAQEAGITREALYRALSPNGNPTLKTLLAVLHAVGMRLSVAPAPAHD